MLTGDGATYDDRAEPEPGVEPVGVAHLRQHAGDHVLGARLVGEADGGGEQRLADALPAEAVADVEVVHVDRALVEERGVRRAR